MSGIAAPSQAPAQAAPSRTGSRAGLVGIIVSAVLFAALYSRLDRGTVLAVLTSANPWLLAAVVATTVPISAMVALRFYWVAPPRSLPSYAEAVRLTLVAKAFNLFLPSKSGDLIKSYVLARRGEVPAGVALSIVVYERLCDMLGLISWCLVGWFVSPPLVGVIPSGSWLFLVAVAGLCLVLVSSQRSAARVLAFVHWLLPSRRLQRLRDLAAGWPELHAAIRGRRKWIALLSIVLWLANMTQLWMLTLVVSARMPFAASLGVFALAVVAGQLPLTFAGFGARDVALVVLSSDYMPAESAAAIGLLSATLGIIPALAAAPVIRPYLAIVAAQSARWRQQRARRES